MGDTTRALLRDVAVITEGVNNLPVKACLSMFLAYYDHTPEDYEPEGFAASDLQEKEMPHWSFKRNIGQVQTKHHSMSLKVVSRQVDREPPLNVVNNNFIQSETETQTQQIENLELVDCVCQSSSRDLLMLKCSQCGSLQHGACYRVISADQEPSRHFCVKCFNDEQPCTDSKLPKSINSPNLALTCLLRRILLKIRGGQGDMSIIKRDMDLKDDHFNDVMAILKKYEFVDNEGSPIHDNIENLGMKKLFGTRTKPKDDLLHKTENLSIKEGVMKRKVLDEKCDKSGDSRNNSTTTRPSKRSKKSKSETNCNIDV